MGLFVIADMDASSTQSSSKCGSDFSIERILSGKKNEENVEAPEWLCCTRYRPPRLPRGTSVCRSRRAGRHARVPFTAAQAAALEAAYSRAPYLAPPALKALAAALQLRDDRIKIWFQNRRARERREKSAIIAPPQGVALAPTTLVGFSSNSWMPQANLDINRSSQISYIQRLKNDDSDASKDKRDNPDLLITAINKRPVNTNAEILGQSQMDSFVSIEVDDDRASTPLDIETVED